jgi:hypothetical protein
MKEQLGLSEIRERNISVDVFLSRRQARRLAIIDAKFLVQSRLTSIV